MENIDFHGSPAATRSICPAVSVIIPMYNAEKYVGECLESILTQTFQDFEVIVVDDCSTDSSVAIVESYIPKFGGRLKLEGMKKNSGNAGYTARNLGFRCAKGEYVFFVDADDFITKTALEELYTAAKNFNADVVYTGSRYFFTSAKGVQLSLDIPRRISYEKGIASKPILTVDDPHKNLRALLMTDGFFWVPWTKFVQRNFLIENEITFFEILSGGDFIWTVELLSRSKRFLQVPIAVYFWRDDSIISTTRKQRPIKNQIKFWCNVILSMINCLKTLSIKLEILRDNPSYIYRALILLFNENFNRISNVRFQVSSQQIYEILYHEFKNEGDADLLIPFLLSLIDGQQKNLLVNQHQFQEFAKKSQSRIAELEKVDRVNKAYISELENFIANSQKYIAELESELKRKEG